jgi:lipopolysaccharide transport system ATP-binding protein
MTNLIQQPPLNQTPATTPILEVSNLSKKFCRHLKRSLFYGINDILTEFTGRDRTSQNLRPQEFWAIENISFQLHPGEALGLIGTNGAGKTTLLRIISGLIKPDTGYVKIRGKIAPLIALGAAFNPILTGRENIYLNMSILGLTTPEINKRILDVIQFAEIGTAIDTPVQTYSSGMVARLGFACAVHIEPDILLIDEVLAVGDLKFRIKCYQKLAELSHQGTAFILVAHNPHVILNICQSSIYLSQGKLIDFGETTKVIRQYEADLLLGNTNETSGIMHIPTKPVNQTLGIDISYLCFKNQKGEIINAPTCGDESILSITCQANKQIDHANLGIIITALSGYQERVLYITSASDHHIFKILPGKIEIQMKMPYICLLPGYYSAKIYIKSGISSLDIVPSFKFTVKPGQVVSQSAFYQPRTWELLNL